jgi:pSer/pThr/pTyr-binding forkhead associated (FHA) protein
LSLRLRIEHGQGAGKTVRLAQAGVYTLGRTPKCSLRILDMKVSKEHCEIQLAESDAAEAVLVDLGSTHGCLVNGQPVSKQASLSPGDEIRLGMTILRVLSNGEADENLRPAQGRNADAKAAPRRGQMPETQQTLPADELIGKELSGYQIEKKIGAGGMGGVYLAEQTSLRRKVALKVLNENFASDSAFVDQFVNEARAAGALNHPNVVQVYDVGSAQGHYYFSMEVMPGGSIEDRVRAGKVEWADGLNWFIDAANALIFAKKREILHRDVKPDNLMLAEDGSAKLCDLGLAKKSEVQDLMDQGIIGTPHFISPEAIRRKADIDQRTDLYSLGCSFYRVFTGTNPFPGRSVKEILLGHLNKPVPRIASVSRDVPREIDEVVAKLMAKDPDERFQTPDELLRQLDRVRTQYNLEAHGIKPASRKPLIIGGVAAAIAIVVAVWFATRPEKIVVPPKTPEELAQEREVKREGVRVGLEGYVNGDATSAMNTLNGKRTSSKNMRHGENWRDPMWKQLVVDYRKNADAWEAKAKAWSEKRVAEEDPTIQGFYRSQAGELARLTDDARKAASEIERFVKRRQALDQRIKEERAQALTDSEAAVKKHAQTIQTAFDERRFKAVERGFHPATIKALIDPLLDRKVEDFVLIEYKEDIRPLLDKHLPGDKEGKDRGKQTVKKAVDEIEAQARRKVEQAEQSLGEEPDDATFDAAILALEEYARTVPEATKEDRATAPLTTAAHGRALARTVNPAINSLRERRKAMRDKAFAEDRGKQARLYRTVWGVDGLLVRFDLQGALDNASLTRTVQARPEYQRLADLELAAVKAVKGLMEHFQSSFPDDWTSKYFWLEDERGRRKKYSIREVSPAGITWSGDLHTYAELGPKQLVTTFLVEEDDDEVTPRFEFTPSDLFGMAVLSELAGEYDLALKYYASAKQAYGDGEVAAIINQRIERAPKEREVAEKYYALRRVERELSAWVAAFETLKAEGKFDRDARTRVHNEKARILQSLQQAQGMLYALLDDRAYAATAWGTAIRETPHPEVAYVGEELPAAPKEPDKKPKDEGGGKPGDADDAPRKPNGEPGDKSGGGVANGGGEKPPEGPKK